MMWCKYCDEAVEPEINTSYEKPNVNVDGYREEKKYKCPECSKELLFDADRCQCGNWKNAEDECCPGCNDLRRELMEKAIEQYRKITNYQGSYKESKEFLENY